MNGSTLCCLMYDAFTSHVQLEKLGGIQNSVLLEREAVPHSLHPIFEEAKAARKLFRDRIRLFAKSGRQRRNRPGTGQAHL